jgi:hypothetical protein
MLAVIARDSSKVRMSSVGNCTFILLQHLVETLAPVLLSFLDFSSSSSFDCLLSYAPLVISFCRLINCSTGHETGRHG